MRLILVRHGHAGSKDEWHRADRLRPLSPRGRRQAQLLAELIAPLGPARIISSPHLRCSQTIEPTAVAAGTKIEKSNSLVPSAPGKALRLIRRLSSPSSESGTVLCTHREILNVVLAEISKKDGIKLERRPPGGKGAVWFLDFGDGRLVAAHYVVPSAALSQRS